MRTLSILLVTSMLMAASVFGANTGYRYSERQVKEFKDEIEQLKRALRECREEHQREIKDMQQKHVTEITEERKRHMDQLKEVDEKQKKRFADSHLVTSLKRLSEENKTLKEDNAYLKEKWVETFARMNNICKEYEGDQNSVQVGDYIFVRISALSKGDPWYKCGQDCGKATILLAATRARENVVRSSKEREGTLVMETPKATATVTWKGAEIEIAQWVDKPAADTIKATTVSHQKTTSGE
jgi:DNA repair exonuclease SbcCD ATPase subunit